MKIKINATELQNGNSYESCKKIVQVPMKGVNVNNFKCAQR